MITHLRGKLIEKNPTYAIIECNGIGYFVHISVNTFDKIPDTESVMILTHLIVKEDDQILFGFMDALEREIFRLLISVSGIGSNTARVMLSSLTTEEIQKAIAGEDVSTIQSVKGIGAKTAQKVILELKDKIIKTYGIEETSVSVSNNTNKEEALSALEVLGFNRKISEKVVNSILKEEPTASVEQIIKLSLKRF